MESFVRYLDQVLPGDEKELTMCFQHAVLWASIRRISKQKSQLGVDLLIHISSEERTQPIYP